MADYFVARQLLNIPMEFLLDVVRFPYWWYSRGLKKVLFWCWQSFRLNRQKLAIGLFMRNFFKPMYQDYSWQGRLISLLARFFILLFKLAKGLLLATWYLLLVLVWLSVLPAAIYALVI